MDIGKRTMLSRRSSFEASTEETLSLAVDHEAENLLLKRREKRKIACCTAAVVTIIVSLILMRWVDFRSMHTNIKEDRKNKNKQVKKKRPNLVFILTDQQREGAHFTKAYTQCPVCGPARTSLLTGKTIENTNIRRNDMEDVPFNATSFDEFLVDEEGYVAEYYGKFHSPPKLKQKYRNVQHVSQNKVALAYCDYLAQVNVTKPTISQMRDGTQIHSFNQRPYRTNPLDNRYGLPPGSTMSNKDDDGNKRISEPDHHGVSEIPEEHTLTAFEANQFLNALERVAAAEDDHPFSLHLSLNNPHAPITPSEPYASMFKVDEMIPPSSIGDPMFNSPYNKANNRHKLTEYADPELIKFMIADYYAFVKEIDVWLGKILHKIDDLGLAENTLLIFTSDHGEMLGAHGMREKNVFYEESVHIPLMLRFPGVIAPGTVIDDPVSHINVFSTVLDYLGAKQQDSDGESLRTKIESQTTMTKKDRQHHESAETPYVVSEWNYHPGAKTPGLMIRTNRWKMFIPNNAESKVMNVLYDLENDPYEMNNLLGENPNRRFYLKEATRLKAMLVGWLTRVNSPHLEEVVKRQL